MPTRDNDKAILRITKNLISFPLATYDALRQTTNAVAVTIRGTAYAIHTLRFLAPTVQEVYEVVGIITYHYYVTTFRLLCDINLHEFKFPDKGYSEFDGTTGNLKKIIKGHESVTAPWPLDGAGHALASGGLTPPTWTLKPYASAAWGINFS